ncbi:MAG: DUF4129 domain-containing protein [Bdellovibrionaceae bacterium]|nr:DUF4129 domain-containing protein [Bdellovibrionales bacterium]MCB9083104.1 DUF4129 domain-containing protein [Pseudobdellovibrionaceae bacterium]
MAKNKRTHPSKHKVQTPRPPSSPSPGRFTQFTLFQVLVLAGLMIPMFLLEGVNHWQTGIFFAAALAFSFLIREGIWGHRDLLQDELVTRDDHESLWLFVFGRMVQDSEGHSKERKRLLYITASGKKYLIRILIVAMVVLYFAWMKNREAVSFRPSAFLYILIFTIMISSVFACQYWAALLVSGVVAIFATSGEWGPYPLAFATFLIALFAALTSYRQSTVEWVYAHERDFLKRGIGPSPLQSVMIVALLAVFSLWFLDKVLPDSLKSQKKASISKKMDEIRSKVAEKVSEQIVDYQEKQSQEPRPGADGFALSPSQREGADVLQQLIGSDSQTAESLASRLTPEELKTLGDMAAAGSQLSGALGRPGGRGDMPAGGGGGRGREGIAGNRPGLDPEAWEKFLKQIRNNPAARHELLKKYPELKQEMDRMAAGGTPSGQLQSRLEEEFVRQKGAIESLPKSEQQKYQQLGKKLGLNKQELDQVLSGKQLNKKQLSGLAQKVQSSPPVHPGGHATQQGSGGGGQDQGPGGVSGDLGSGGGDGDGSGPGGDQTKNAGKGQKEGKKGILPPPKLTREQRQEKARLKVEQALKFFENAAIALLYVAAVLLIYMLFTKFSDRQKDETKPAGRLSRDDRKSLVAELKQMRSRPLSPQEEVVKSYHLFLRVMELVQYPRAQEITPTDFAHEVIRHFPRLRDPVPYVSEVFCQVFYGKRDVEAGTLGQFRTHFRKVFRQFGLKAP